MKKEGIIGDLFFKKNGTKAQVWVETVTYTLIAFVMIGLVLSFAKPKIEEYQDKIITEQSVKMLKEIDLIISEVSEEGIGNKRKIELGLKKGSIEIIPENDSLIFTMKTRHIYSEPEEKYVEGALTILTKEKGTFNDLTMRMNYSSIYNITFDLKESSKTISSSPTPYNVFISNNGNDGGDLKVINFQID